MVKTLYLPPMLSPKDAMKSLYMKFFPERFKNLSFGELRKFNWADLGVKNFEPEFLLMPLLLKNEDVFFDVGANIGQYTDVVSNLLYPNNIYVFEPNPVLARRLRFLFPKCRVHHLALSDRSGSAVLNIPVNGSKVIDTRASLLEDETEANTISIKVNTISIDEFVAEQNLNKLDLVKIDVEGFEMPVLLGAKNTLNKFKPSIILEIDSYHYSDGGDSVLKFINELNYDIYYFSSELGKIVEIRQGFKLIDIQSIEDRGVSKKYINNFILKYRDPNNLHWLESSNQWIQDQIKAAN